MGHYSLGNWSQVEISTEEARLRGAFHPYTLVHIMTAASESAPPNQSPQQVQQVAKVALWGLPVLLVGGYVLGRYMRKKKR